MPSESTHAAYRCTLTSPYRVVLLAATHDIVRCGVDGWLQFRANGEGLLNLNNGTTLIKSCSSEGSEAPECKCAGARLTSSDINWYANNIPWNVDKMYYAKTMCTGPSQCEDWFHVNVQDFTNFNRDNRPPTIHYIYMHVDGSMPINPASIVLKRVEGTIPAQVQVTFTVEITHQTMSPIPVRHVYPSIIAHYAARAFQPRDRSIAADPRWCEAYARSRCAIAAADLDFRCTASGLSRWYHAS